MNLFLITVGKISILLMGLLPTFALSMMAFGTGDWMGCSSRWWRILVGLMLVLLGYTIPIAYTCAGVWWVLTDFR